MFSWFLLNRATLEQAPRIGHKTSPPLAFDWTVSVYGSQPYAA